MAEPGSVNLIVDLDYSEVNHWKGIQKDLPLRLSWDLIRSDLNQHADQTKILGTDATDL